MAMLRGTGEEVIRLRREYTLYDYAGRNRPHRQREPYTPMTPYDGDSDETVAIGRFLREHGLYTVTRWTSMMTSPLLCITAEQRGRCPRSSTGRSRRRPSRLRLGGSPSGRHDRRRTAARDRVR